LAGLATLGLVDGTTWHYDFYGFDLTPLRVDGLSLAFAYVFAIALLAGGIFGMATMGTLERTSALVYAASAFGVVFAGDVVTLFFFWELKVSASTLLVFARRTAASSAAALRYLFVNLAGGIVLLAGIVWWVIDTGSLTFGNFGLNGGATVLILIGFCVAAAAVPLLPPASAFPGFNRQSGTSTTGTWPGLERRSAQPLASSPPQVFAGRSAAGRKPGQRERALAPATARRPTDGPVAR
jgi:formate hydrogenlyase subunit 3/multisubunit Na+/H+ antiporter MnhD subunit